MIAILACAVLLVIMDIAHPRLALLIDFIIYLESEGSFGG
jgi:hypothetical protein